jgi:hypothetical protein
MIDTCVCCGEIIPEGQQVCGRCLNGGPACPECGNTLTVMHSTYEVTPTSFEHVVLYNCDKCCSDWERRSRYIGEPVEFKRKIWG